MRRTGDRASFVVVHSITSPYRVHLFNVLHEELEARALGLHVHFMRRRPAHRPQTWQARSRDLTFPHTFWRDIGPTVKGKTWHLNPGLVAHLARRWSDYLLVGGPWSSVTGMLVTATARRRVAIGWVEGNTRTPGRLTGPVGWFKRALLRQLDLLAVPGAEGRRFAALLAGGGRAVSTVSLPNIVDETRFRAARPDAGARAALRRELGVSDGHRLALWPARLIPDKGVLELVGELDAGDLEGWTIVVLGDGPLRDPVRARLAERGLGERIRLAEPVAYDRMPAIYQASDLFMLPSFRDSNPLAVVEAMHAGLPLLLSERVGNLPEALRAGENGWALDPANPASVRAAVRAAFSAAPERLKAMGARSRQIAAEQWGSRTAVRRFLHDVMGPV